MVKKVDWYDPSTAKTGASKDIVLTPVGSGKRFEFSIGKDGSIKSIEDGTPLDWKGKKLDEVLGKGLADKIMEKESGNLSGDGLKFGGEWADNLYDKQAGNIVKDLTGAEILVMDMGLPVEKERYKFLNDSKKGTLGEKLLKSEDLKVGLQIDKDQTKYIITDILGDGKFKAVPKDILENFKNQEVGTRPITKETLNSATLTFDISTKTTTQQGIRLTPEIKARIRGEALDIQTSGRQFEDTTSQLRADFQAAKKVKTENLETEGFGEKNKVFTKESLDEAMKSLRSKMTGLHSGVDPTIIADLTKIGGYYFEGGLRDFSSWSKKLLSELGEKIRPYLKDVWDNINRDFSKTSSPVQDDIYTRNRLIKKGSPTRGGDVNFAEKLFTPISSRLKRINPSLKQALTKFEYDTANSIMSDTNAATPFLESVKKMSADDRADLDLAFKNGDVKKIDEVVKKYGISKQYKSIRSTLDSIHKKALEVGLDVGYIENYHPRIIKDVKGFLDHVRGGKHWSLISEAIQKKETELGRYLTDEEKAYAINTLLRGYSLGQIKLERPGNLKEREIDIITPEFNAFYEDSSSALVKYIEQVNENIAARRFFGKSEAFSNIDNSIGAYTARLLAEGKLTPNQELEVKQILQSRFNARGTSGPITIYKNLSYIDTMGSMVSAITQIGDLAFSLYRNGFLNTSSSFIEAVQGRSELTKRDLGIDKIAEEFKDTTRTGKWLKKVFNMTGLTWMDSLGKETLINSSIKNLRNLASKPTGEFEDRIEEVFGNESSQVIKDLKSGEITENVRLLAFSELSKFQPITLSEMPEKYLTGGNGRIFYMLKSYTIKQLDAVRNESFDLIAKGETAKGLGNLVRLSVALMAMNATADLIKDLLLNRPIEIEDLVIDNILRLLGFSRWQLYKARQEGVGTMLWQTITPPAKLVDSIIKDSSAIYNQKLESLPDLETIQSVPLVGKLFYWWFGKGSIKSDRKRGGGQKKVIK